MHHHFGRQPKMHHHFGRQPKMHHHFGRQLPTAFSCRSGPAPLASRPIGREPASPTTRDRRTEYNGRRHRLLDSWHFDPPGKFAAGRSVVSQSNHNFCVV
jgi:hypothetical protein